MTTKQLQDLKDKIMEDLDSLKQEILKLQQNTKPISPDCSLGTLGRFELMHDQQVDERALHEAQLRVKKLEYALQKVQKDGYGLCIDCGDEILFERLLILPESLYCVECASNLQN